MLKANPLRNSLAIGTLAASLLPGCTASTKNDNPSFPERSRLTAPQDTMTALERFIHPEDIQEVSRGKSKGIVILSPEIHAVTIQDVASMREVLARQLDSYRQFRESFADVVYRTEVINTSPANPVAYRNDTIYQLAQALGRKPSDAELRSAMSTDPMTQILGQLGIPAEGVDSLETDRSKRLAMAGFIYMQSLERLRGLGTQFVSSGVPITAQGADPFGIRALGRAMTNSNMPEDARRDLKLPDIKKFCFSGPDGKTVWRFGQSQLVEATELSSAFDRWHTHYLLDERNREWAKTLKRDAANHAVVYTAYGINHSDAADKTINSGPSTRFPIEELLRKNGVSYIKLRPVYPSAL